VSHNARNFVQGNITSSSVTIHVMIQTIVQFVNVRNCLLLLARYIVCSMLRKMKVAEAISFSVSALSLLSVLHRQELSPFSGSLCLMYFQLLFVFCFIYGVMLYCTTLV